MTRFLCCCSAVLLLAGCGGGGSYTDPHAPLRYGDRVVGSQNGVDVHRIAFAGAGGAPVYGFLATPHRAGRYPAVLFLHGSGGTSSDFLQWAEALAGVGVVGMTIQQPNDAVDYTPLVVNARRALDALQHLHDVDGSRLGVLGFSLGAQTAAILAGVDGRVRAASTRKWACACRTSRSTSSVPQPKRVRWFDAPHTLTYQAFVGQLKWLRDQLR